MNIARAIEDHAPQALQDIDTRIAVLTAELRSLHVERAHLATHLIVASLGKET